MLVTFLGKTRELNKQRIKFRKIVRINAIVVNLLKNIQPIRRMVIQKYVTEENGSAFLELFPFIPFIKHTASLTTFKKRHCLP